MTGHRRRSISECHSEGQSVLNNAESGALTYGEEADEFYDEEIPKFIPRPPDGGYGWVVVFASFMANFIVDGISYAFAVYLPVFAKRYHSSQASTALVGSLVTGCTLISGPIVSGLVNKFGSRIIMMVGSVIATVAFLISAWAPTLPHLMFTYGVVGGMGFALIYLPAIVHVSYYFETKRAFATGIAVSGSGVGTFVMAPLLVILIEEYGLKGSLWLVAGICLNGLVFGSLLRPLPLDESPQLGLDTNESEELGSPTHGRQARHKPLLERIAEDRHNEALNFSINSVGSQPSRYIDHHHHRDKTQYNGATGASCLQNEAPTRPMAIRSVSQTHQLATSAPAAHFSPESTDLHKVARLRAAVQSTQDSASGRSPVLPSTIGSATSRSPPSPPMASSPPGGPGGLAEIKEEEPATTPSGGPPEIVVIDATLTADDINGSGAGSPTSGDPLPDGDSLVFGGQMEMDNAEDTVGNHDSSLKNTSTLPPPSGMPDRDMSVEPIAEVAEDEEEEDPATTPSEGPPQIAIIDATLTADDEEEEEHPHGKEANGTKQKMTIGDAVELQKRASGVPAPNDDADPDAVDVNILGTSQATLGPHSHQPQSRLQQLEHRLSRHRSSNASGLSRFTGVGSPHIGSLVKRSGSRISRLSAASYADSISRCGNSGLSITDSRQTLSPPVYGNTVDGSVVLPNTLSPRPSYGAGLARSVSHMAQQRHEFSRPLYRSDIFYTGSISGVVTLDCPSQTLVKPSLLQCTETRWTARLSFLTHSPHAPRMVLVLPAQCPIWPNNDMNSLAPSTALTSFTRVPFQVW